MWNLLLALILASGVAVPPAAVDDETLVIEADVVYTMNGEPLRPGMILIRDGKILEVGPQIENATARRVRVHSVLPGLVDAATGLGISGGDSELTNEVTPELKIVSAIDWRSRDFLQAADSGITTAHILPGTNNVFCGASSIVKTGGSGTRVVTPHAGDLLAICSDPTARNSSRSRPDSIYNRQPTNRMGVVWIVRSQMRRARQGVDAGSGPKLLAIAEMLQSERPIFSVSRTNHDILTAITLGKELDFRTTIIGGDEAYRVLDPLAAEKMSVVYTALTTGAAVGQERTSLRWNVPGKMEAAGIEYCLAGGRLLEQAQFAVRFGASAEGALAAITSTPASILGVADRVGSIAPGRDADLLALSGDPLSLATRMEWTMIGGEVVAGQLPEPAANER